MTKMIKVESCNSCPFKEEGFSVISDDVCAFRKSVYFNIKEPSKILPGCPLEDHQEKKRFEDWYYTPESVEFEKSDDILPVKFAKLWKIAQS